MADIFVTTPKFRGVYLYLTKPKVSKNYPNQDPKYSVTAAFPPNTDFSKFEAALLAAAKDRGWPSIPTALHPLKINGDLISPLTQFPDDWRILTIKARKEEPPYLLDRNGNDIFDPNELYSGAWYDCQGELFSSRVK